MRLSETLLAMSLRQGLVRRARCIKQEFFHASWAFRIGLAGKESGGTQGGQGGYFFLREMRLRVF